MNLFTSFLRILAEETGPEHTEAATLDFGLSPMAVIVTLLVIMLIVWLVLRSQSSRDDLHAADSHDDHGHGGHGEHAGHGDHDAHAAAPAAAAAPSEPDNLKKVEGIGPKVAELLNNNGIQTFSELAAANVDRLKEILESAEYAYMDPASWPEQAKLAAAGDWDALKELQDRLQGGR